MATYGRSIGHHQTFQTAALSSQIIGMFDPSCGSMGVKKTGKKVGKAAISVVRSVKTNLKLRLMLHVWHTGPRGLYPARDYCGVMPLETSI